MSDKRIEDDIEVLGVVEVPSEKNERVLQIAAVVPIHTVLSGKRPNGRPKKIDKEPSPNDLVYHAKMAEAQVEFITKDPLVQAIAQRKDTAETLSLVRHKLAEINSALEFDATEMGKFGRKDVATVRGKQIQALNSISQIDMEMQKRGSTVIDLKGEQFQKVFKLWVETMRSVAKEAFTAEQANLYFNKLETAFAGWEEKASSVLR
jgi:hypothetical protein